MAGYPANIPRFRLRLTREAIEQNGFTLRDGTDLQVDAQMVNANGYTRLEYLTFRVRILHSQAFAGYPSVPERERQRVVVEAGEYDARLTLREYVPVVGPENCLQLVDADKRGGDLFIKVSEYDELETFPVEVNPLHIEILSVRVTSPDEI
ncbi:hypothetical protein [Burkholderia sp. Ac-20392]|uniref:hypothetical protein n=1 Tax=Burkholderia sp. Ac-20392 TaxID=2703905 RepID=UPI001980C835|nr:hypothetical protein [Burkholderia sp. Ac-20392]MBN3794382.1 hypothetical protein [Burkholderia sp. Ac-20392]